MPTDPLLQVISGPTKGLLVFAVPPSGSGPSLYRRWLADRPAGLELVAIHTPGRESRFAEPPASSLTPLVDDIAAAIDEYAERPYVLFGHSAGALLAREVAWRLRRKSRPLSLLVVAGSAAPDVVFDTSLLDADDATLIEALREWRAIPDDMLDDDVAEVILPVMRADMAVAATCRLGRPPTDEERLDIPIVAMTGEEDPAAEIHLRSWAAWTDTAHAAHLLPGGHFFPFEHPAAVLEILADDVRRLAGRRSPGG